MSTDPDQIRDDIEATRQDLSANVNALTDSVRPGAVARRQADKVTGAVAGLKDRIMGSDEESGSPMGSASSSLHDAKDAAAGMPERTRQGTRGNPLAAGLIAFGAGWLLGSLLPASTQERQAAETLKDKAQPLTEQVTQAAKDIGSNLQEPAQNALADLKESASQAADNVKGEAQSGADELRQSAQEAAGSVRDERGH